VAASERRPRRYAVLDVFTEVPLAGNALAVVLDGDGLDEATMLRFARETRLAETTFVQSSPAPEADYRNRIFTVVEEVPFAGHPSLGTAVAVARASDLTEASYTQDTGAGLQPVTVRVLGELAHASVLQRPPELGPELEPGTGVEAVGLDRGAAHPDMPPQVASTGLPTLIVPVADEDAVSRAAPRFPAVDELLGDVGAQTLYLVAIDPGQRSARARMFSPLVREGEDPATGSAAGPLCAYAARHAGVDGLEVSQGVEIDRPSRLVCELEGDRVRVGGGVVPVVEGTVLL
jgi:trans-2,3-dihydro-3-hydroxyanthranilate isomerase